MSRFKVQKGQGTVETLFVIMVFTMLICVVSSLSLYLYMQFSLVTAAREGSRAAAINPDMIDDPATAQAQVKTRVKNFFLNATGQTLPDGNITINGPTNVGGTTRVVDVQVNYTFTSPVNIAGFLGAPDISNYNMSAAASMRYEE